MAMIAEEHGDFTILGDINAEKLVRHPAGNWSMDLMVNIVLKLPDGREFVARRMLGVRVVEKSGG